MPLAFFLVSMIILVGSWYEMENQEQDRQMIVDSEAQAIASNIASYHSFIMRCARHTEPDGTRPMWAAFTAHIGDASLFMMQCEAAGHGLPDWHQGLFPGVNMTIAGAQVTVTYTPIQGLHASRAGVQRHLSRISRNGIFLGQPIEGY